jgi:hypothetical protein
VTSATLEAMGDLGFQIPKSPVHEDHGVNMIEARTPDGRPVKLTLTP